MANSASFWLPVPISPALNYTSQHTLGGISFEDLSHSRQSCPGHSGKTHELLFGCGKVSKVGKV